MLRLAVLLVGSRPLAEEIVQDAFSAVVAKGGAVERPGAYLRASVVNGCRMALRRRDTERRHAPAPGLLGADAPSELVELHDVLQRLPQRQREALVLHHLLDLTSAEIGVLLECPAATVRSLIRRGLAQMRTELP
jgi:RNA polymerase sigma factor (sigma-70 family)